MKKLHFYLFFALCASGLYFSGFGFEDNQNNSNSVFLNNDNSKIRSNPDRIVDYFRTWHEPYGTITADMRLSMVKDIEKLPQDASIDNRWVFMGPAGFNNQAGTDKSSGRILDIRGENLTSVRVAAASGGIWDYLNPNPVPLSDKLSATLNIGSFDIKPGDANTMIVGTGEPRSELTGAGLFRTINGGASYQNIVMNPTPNAFFLIRYSTANSQIVHAATVAGYYRSADGGDTWTRVIEEKSVTDLAINPANNDIIYAPVWNDGLYKSVNGGVSWTRLTTGGIPTANFGRTTVSICAANPNIIYANIARNDNNNTLGVFKSVDNGTTWTNITPPEEFHNGQGWYNTICGVSPTDANKIIVGGVKLFRSNNGGTTWSEIQVHADQHAIAWSNNGNTCWIGNDGGVYTSVDGGQTFSSTANNLPITQYVYFDITPNGTHCYGGSQDNGISGTVNRGASWYLLTGGDGAGVAIDPVNPLKIAVTDGAWPEPFVFRRSYTDNGGQSFNPINNGVAPSGQFNPSIRNDRVNPVILYSNAAQNVYTNPNYGNNWTALNPAPFPCEEILNISLTKRANNTSVVYVCLVNNPPTANKLRVFDNGTWFERSTGFPADNNVRRVTPHPTNTNIAYALINGLGTPGQKIFKTVDKGVTWTNISGNIPDIPMADIQVHPTNENLLYLGTGMGCYKSIDGGTTWTRWNAGLPNATIISEFGVIDSIAANGKYYMVIATYGRSIYYREVSGDDPLSVNTNVSGIPGDFDLQQNYPNPFNPVTTIRFTLPETDNIKLLLYNSQGVLQRTILDRKVSGGVHSVEVDGSELSSGVYFYQLVGSSQRVTKSMILLK